MKLQYKSLNKATTIKLKNQNALYNLKLLIKKKYNYKVNKKKYNRLNNFYNSIVFLQDELKENDKQLDIFYENINKVIMQLVLIEYNETKEK